MDIDRHDSDGDEYEPKEDEDDKEAPSEQDTDDAASRGESDHVGLQDEECESIHTPSPPRDFGDIPLRAQALDFEPYEEHVTSLAEPAEDTYRDDDQEGYPNDENEDVPENEDPPEATQGGMDEDIDNMEQEVAREEDREDDGEDDQPAIVVEDEAKGDAAELTPATTSRPSTASHPSESGEELPTPVLPKSKSSKRGKHKDRQSKRHSSRVQEPVIAESVLEDKIVGILSKTLPDMLSGLLQQAMGLTRLAPQQAPQQSTPTVEVAVGSAEPPTVIDQVVATQDIGVQGMDVLHVDGATNMDAAPTTKDTDNAEANVSIRSP